MDAAKHIFNQQKGIKGYEDLRKYSTIVSITEITKSGNRIYLKDEDGTNYVHFIKFENKGWEDYLKVGNNVRVFVIERKVKNNTYLNVYPDHYSKNVLVSDDDL